MQLLETNGPSRKATPSEETHSRAAVRKAEEGASKVIWKPLYRTVWIKLMSA